jgi:hypothetical protein
MKRTRSGRCRPIFVLAGFCVILGSTRFESSAHAEVKGGQTPLPTTVADFFQPGTQPETITDGVLTAAACAFCHAQYVDSYNEPWDGWITSAMGQSARDPVWHAALAIANQDARLSGEYCIRCHAPGAWLDGRSLPPDGSGFIWEGATNDFDGVVCHFCHRSVNPVLEADSPAEDIPILNALGSPPGDQRGNGRYVVDPVDVRRGPFDDVPQNLHGVPIIHSPFHRRSEVCATCHDLGNPVFLLEEDGTFTVSDKAAGHEIGQPHGTQDPHQMFPEQRTYSEWESSQFANGGVLFKDGRFGGNHPTGLMQECQDCHMPDQDDGGCFAFEDPPFFPRPDLPQHSFAGANTWILDAVRGVWDDGDSGLEDQEAVDAAKARVRDMLRSASDTQALQLDDMLKVRVINFSGHKLPTGYPEGRRMWVNVRFYDETEQLLGESGHYDFGTAELTEGDTKVYQAVHGIGADVAAATNLPAGASSHLVLNNELLLDNRIPPIGFTNAAYEAVLSNPIGYVYDDGQYWDDTEFLIPDESARAVITLYYQPMTKEYVEFLRDANTGPPGNAGDVLYDLWSNPAIGNMVPPTDMDMIEVDLTAQVEGDVIRDGVVGFDDLIELLSQWGPCPPPDMCRADLDCDGVVGFSDLILVLANFGAGS